MLSRERVIMPVVILSLYDVSQANLGPSHTHVSPAPATQQSEVDTSNTLIAAQGSFTLFSENQYISQPPPHPSVQIAKATYLSHADRALRWFTE